MAELLRDPAQLICVMLVVGLFVSLVALARGYEDPQA